MTKEFPDHDCGALPITVSRVGFGYDAEGQCHSSMFMNGVHGTGKAPDGAEIEFGSDGSNVNVTFRYKGDKEERGRTRDAEYQQTYVIKMKDIIEAIYKLNKVRRTLNFEDAPPTRLK